MSGDEKMNISEGDVEAPTASIGLAAHNYKQLPQYFVPGENDVICGRGRKCFNHPGNKRFRGIVASYLEKYSKTNVKLEKTLIICDIVNKVRQNACGQGGFVKKDPVTGLYYEVGDFLAVRTFSELRSMLSYTTV
jgi:hypothetical protein